MGTGTIAAGDGDAPAVRFDHQPASRVEDEIPLDLIFRQDGSGKND
jgi:hypothetical protein